MKVYLAASTLDMDRARTWYARLRLAGIEIVSTWIATVEKVGSGNPADATHEQRRDWSAKDLAEVRSADVLWILVPAKSVQTRGIWAELGTAWAHDVTIVTSGETLQSIFCALGDEHPLDEDAFASICALAIEYAKPQSRDRRVRDRSAAVAVERPR